MVDSVLFFSVFACLVVVTALSRPPSLMPHRITFYLTLLIAAVLLLQVREGSEDPLAMRSW